ncbi:MAG: putative glycosyltransferase, type 1 [Candidatus Parcubacteria bacterium]|jgi:glycosyltransferase involved in cell wall biosynthesis
MRIFFITSKLNFENAGGSVEEFDLMMRVWQQQGADVTAVTMYSGSNKISHPLPYALIEEHQSARNVIDIQRNIFRVLKKYEHDADFFHVDGQQFLYGAGLYRRLGGRVPVQAYFNRELMCWPPLLSTLFPDGHSRESVTERAKRSLWWLAERVVGMPLANGIDKRLYVCPQFKETYEKFGMSKEGSILLDPVDVRAIQQACGITSNSYRARNKTQGPFTIFYSGRMVPGKGYDVLISAFAHLRNKEDFRLILGGGGPEEKNVRNLVAHYHLEPYVEMPGWVEMDQVYRRSAAADIFVQPDWIPFGTSITLIKAMAFGLPCIVPAGGGLEWLAGSAAITFERKNPESLARAIERLGADADLRARLSAGCAERLSHSDFDYKTKLREAYEEMLLLTRSLDTPTPVRR